MRERGGEKVNMHACITDSQLLYRSHMGNCGPDAALYIF
jgi:hypothetical protein